MTANDYLKSIQDNFDGIEKNLETMIPVSALDDIKKEIGFYLKHDEDDVVFGLNKALEIINNHIRKGNE